VSSATHESTTLDFVEEYAAAAEKFAVAVAFADMRAPVPSCPGWSTYDLVVHVGNVHAWAATIVETGRPTPEQSDHPRSSRSRTVSSWYAGKAEDLYQVLRDARPDDPCWNFAFGAGVKAFWPRRQLHETTIHDVDLHLSQHREVFLTPEVCVDGVGEVLGVFLQRMHQRGYPTRLERPLALTATDTGDTWVVAPQPQPTSTATSPPLVPPQPHGSPAEAVPEPVPDAGPTMPPSFAHRRLPSDGVRDRVEAPVDVLYRLLWRRLPVDDPAVVVSGDADRVHAFLTSRLVP